MVCLKGMVSSMEVFECWGATIIISGGQQEGGVRTNGSHLSQPYDLQLTAIFPIAMARTWCRGYNMPPTGLPQ